MGYGIAFVAILEPGQRIVSGGGKMATIIEYGGEEIKRYQIERALLDLERGIEVEEEL